ncbi:MULTISPECIES: homocysteine S-methyltransferase family protein [unclassified Brevundimonas]|uniref:homocysteine S-methyltransferase family protein n=1 Tax=unclassified Brevundimonas TaxID=2622653 RepID=UPI003F9184DB
MSRFRNALPQLGGDMFLTDAGLETDLIFNRNIPIREFAAHTLLPDPAGRAALEAYFSGFLRLAQEVGAGFILDAVTWKAQRRWASDLQASIEELQAANEAAVAFAAALRDRADNARPIVLGALIGPQGDAYRPERRIAAEDAEGYFAEQLGWLAATEVDMVTGLTFNQAGEAVGLVRAAKALGLPAVISFTVETDGALPDGQPLAEAIAEVDAETDQGPAYFMINCAHPDHFASVLDGRDWTRRIRGVRANASRRSHVELDEAPDLDAGDPDEFGQLHGRLRDRLPWINIWGACCGGDLRHVSRIARAVSDGPPA